MDSALAGGRDIPDLTVFSTKVGRAIKTPDHAYAVFEVKRGHDVADNSAEIYTEKKKYIKAGTRWFFILDQEEVHKWDVMAKTEAAVYRWEDLTNPERFGVCFAEVRPSHVALEEQLKDFRDGRTRYAFQSIDELGHRGQRTMKSPPQHCLWTATTRTVTLWTSLRPPGPRSIAN